MRCAFIESPLIPNQLVAVMWLGPQPHGWQDEECGLSSLTSSLRSPLFVTLAGTFLPLSWEADYTENEKSREQSALSLSERPGDSVVFSACARTVYTQPNCSCYRN